jgi:hypothetical protein
VETMTDAPEIPVGTENPENLKTITESRKSETKNYFLASISVVLGLIVLGVLVAIIL